MAEVKNDYHESPSGGVRKLGAWVKDQVKDANSGLSEGGFFRGVHKFNTNSVERSPTTSSNDCRGSMEQKIRIKKGIAGKIG